MELCEACRIQGAERLQPRLVIAQAMIVFLIVICMAPVGIIISIKEEK
jgi:hypothetical protein